MNKILLKIHSTVDVITNSSSELFSVTSDVETVNEFINDFLETHELQYSGEAGEINVKTLREEIEECIVDADKGLYGFRETFAEYVYEDCETHEEKFNFILKDYCSYFTNDVISIDLDKMIIINIDQANRELIGDIKNLFPGYISLN